MNVKTAQLQHAPALLHNKQFGPAYMPSLTCIDAIAQGLCHCPPFKSHTVRQLEAEVTGMIYKGSERAVYGRRCKEAHVRAQIVAPLPADDLCRSALQRAIIKCCCCTQRRMHFAVFLCMLRRCLQMLRRGL